ncbi:MAG TPA: hypothetical protein VHL09_14925 [Dehalococcoidia bacterium]|nr:hypothetical protein [Dehalococcoidia bacterium]
MSTERTVLVVVKDLFFQTRLAGGLTHLGFQPRFVEAVTDLPAVAEVADLAIVDLAARQIDPIAAIGAIRGYRPDLPLLAFGSHLNLDLRQRALDAGATRVVANSAIATDLVGVVGRLLSPSAGGGAPDEERV